MKRRVYKSTSEDREGDFVNVILEATVYNSSPFACLPSLYARNATLQIHAVCCLAPQARRICGP